MIRTFVLSLAIWPMALSIASAQSPPPIRFGLGDAMTMLVQPRHIKLGLGGQARNWDYAAYEFHELEEAFEKVERGFPRHGTFSITDFMRATKEPMAAVAAAIKAKDGARFDVAYKDLTTACNACHRGTNHPMVVIQFPAATAPFPNQDFTPQKP